MAERGFGKIRGAYLATKILSILVNWGADILEMGMDRVEEGSTDEGTCWEGGGGVLIPVESPRIGSSQAVVLEYAQALGSSDVFINFWELSISAEEIIEEKFLQIPDVASYAVLVVCLSKTLTLLKISSGSETGVAGGPFGFALVLGLLEATLFLMESPDRWLQPE